MRIQRCRQCGFILDRQANKCLWCKSPVKNKKALLIPLIALFVFSALTEWLRHEDNAIISPPKEVRALQEEHLIKPSIKGPRKIVYVRGNIVNLRQNPSQESPTLWKLKKGQRMIQVNRVGNWVQVVSIGDGDKHGWVHASLIGKVKSHATKIPLQTEAFKTFLTSFDQFNGEIKKSKGMTFFNEVVHLGHGVIQVTAADILISAPKSFRRKYVRQIMQMWVEANTHNAPATVRIVDKEGYIRMEEVRKE